MINIMKTLWQNALPLYAAWCSVFISSSAYALSSEDNSRSAVPPGTITTIIIETRKRPVHIDRRTLHNVTTPNGCCRAGMTLPIEYRTNENTIDADHYPQLSQPTRYQQWVRVNNQYMLLNVLTHTVIKVVVVRE